MVNRRLIRPGCSEAPGFGATVLSQLSSDAVSAHAADRSLLVAAALAAAGPDARLLVPRVVIGAATCALAITEDVT